MDADGRMEIIRGLCSFANRLTGTDSERRAANWLAERLRERGRRANVEPIYVHPQYGLVHGAHCALGFAGSLAAIAEPVVGFGIVLAAATSMYLDLNGRIYLLRTLFFRRASQNVVSPGPSPDAPARLILTAHYDAARTGAAFAPARVRRAARLAARLPFPFGPFRLLFWSLALLLPLIGARMAELDSEAISLLQLPPTLVLMVAVFAFIDIELSDVVPGANDNASGVATALSLADQLDREPTDNLDVWVVLTGGEECLQEGMRAYLRAHRKELDRERTLFLNLDTLGQGRVRFETTAGWVVSFDLDRRMAELATAVAEADRDGPDRYRAEPLRHGLAGDSMPPRLRGYRSLGIMCLDEDGYVPHYHLPSDTPDNVDSQAIDRAHDFTLELIRQVDRDVARRG